MKLAFLYTAGRLQRLDSVHAGASASEFFYGAEEIRRGGMPVDLFEVGPHDAHAWAQRAVDFLFARGWLPNRTRGWVLLGTRRRLPELRAYDVVVATSTGLAFSLAIWKALGRFRPRIVAIHCGIFNYHPNRWRRWQIRSLLRRMRSVVFGEAECPVMRALFGVDPERLQVNPFGVDENFWRPAESPGHAGFVLAVGNDSRRDYPLLIEAARRVSAKVILVTRQSLPGPLPPNVEVRQSSWHQEVLSDAELRDLYRRAACVAVPLVDSFQPSGQSVTLQAMACGRPVVLTRTRGLWSAEHMRDGANCLLVPPGDAAALTAALTRLIQDDALNAALGAAARQSVLEHFRIAGFAQRLEALCRVALEAPTS